MIRPVIVIAMLCASMPAVAQAVAEKETSIAFASNGGIRNFQRGPADSNLVYLQDRTLKWYRVTLTGPCPPLRSLDAVQFTTDINGSFDRFSQIKSVRFPGQICGVTSIVASAPPPGQPGAAKTPG